MKMSKLRGISLVAWIAVCLMLFKFMPNLDKLTLEKGQPSIPKEYSVKIAGGYAKEFNQYNKDSKISNVILAF